MKPSRKKAIWSLLWLVFFISFFLVSKFISNNFLNSESIELKINNGRPKIWKIHLLAHLGDTTAQCLLGSIYAYGLGGVPRDDDLTIYWFKRCGPLVGYHRESGEDAIAAHEFYIGKSYYEGDEVEKNIDLSRKWFRRAAEAGNRKASEYLEKIGR